MFLSSSARRVWFEFPYVLKHLSHRNFDSFISRPVFCHFSAAYLILEQIFFSKHYEAVNRHIDQFFLASDPPDVS